jgi:PAS domain S-box-containing protein
MEPTPTTVAVHNGAVALRDDLPDDIYRWVFEQSSVAYSVLDLDGRQIATNRAFADLMGLDPQDTDLVDVDIITRDSDRTWTNQYLSRLVSGDLTEYTTEKTYVRVDGEEVLCRLTARALRDTEGHVVAILGAIEPIVERPVVSDDRMRKMIEHIDDTISLIDANGALLDTSGRYRATLGYPKEFWATRTIFDVLHPDDAASVLALRDEVLLEPGRHVSGEYRVRNVDGGYETIEVHAVNLLDDPDVGGLVITSRNITARNTMLAEIAARRDEAVAQADLRTRLIATVSHELRNPLHAMGGLSELLATGDLPSEMAGLAATLHRQILGLNRVIDDLLETSRLDIGVIDLKAEPMVLRGLVDDIVMLGRSLADGRAVEVSASLGAAVPAAVVADPSRLRQVLGNLVGNAVKFTDTGHVQLHVHTEVTPHTDTHPAADWLVFEVVDTGRGIPAHQLDAVFEPFSTASTGGTRVGAGLGLSIVRQIVELMGGSTSLSSEVGLGSTFVVRLPLVAAETPDTATSAGAGVSVQVLVVEDNPVNQMLAKNQLERLGMVPVIVGSGEDALALIERGDSPRIILMDHQLPGMDGLECTQRIREMEGGRPDRAVIIGVTASAMAADRDACLIGGMDDFLAKPVSLHDLGATLQRWAAVTHASTRQPDDLGHTASGHDASDTPTDTPGGNAVHDAPALDQATLDKLADELGGNEVVVMLATTYLDELTTRIASLTEASAAGDLTAISRSAHTLKSSSRLLGGLTLGDLCQDAEHATDLPAATALVPEVVALAERFAAELSAWMAAA